MVAFGRPLFLIESGCGAYDYLLLAITELQRTTTASSRSIMAYVLAIRLSNIDSSSIIFFFLSFANELSLDLDDLKRTYNSIDVMSKALGDLHLDTMKAGENTLRIVPFSDVYPSCC
ncbi:uncharacterized protein BT62DRAFT_1010920 [Guyanagaster necrorhizus]|uniref:Uncharacterized protein n=1 Tax=Guyanagaster necrorhizus TaxID=856835 RepID=A0A9P7VJZ8_9AGAR|nr:uncharacterized protein BT62DRAFT_1010920 [Guyanagaster necrorhizus MCA 3950]KAG7441897.1 hypothetical protein BT62DRAFT_1010920 [Guyanagaster necrorhizus MCA 3950]